LKHFPTIPIIEQTPEQFGLALYLEQQYWTNMSHAVANGIALAFEGDE